MTTEFILGGITGYFIGCAVVGTFWWMHSKGND